jgi:uncharacterized protein
MKFAALIEYITNTQKVSEVRPLHRAYLTQLMSEGKIVCAGPFLDDFGALIVYEAADKASAEAMLLADPFHTHGVFVRWDLRPWKIVFVPPEGVQPG